MRRSPSAAAATLVRVLFLQVELVEPPAGSEPGDRVSAQGSVHDPIAVLKKEGFDPIAANLATNAGCVACFNGVPLETSSGPCKVKSIANGSIR